MMQKTDTTHKRASLFGDIFKMLREYPGPVIFLGASILVIGLTLSLFGVHSTSLLPVDGIKEGAVAERDVVADRSLTYVDEESTALRREARERLVHAVFRHNEEITREVIAHFEQMAAFMIALLEERSSREAFLLAVQERYPAFFPVETLNKLYAEASPVASLKQTGNLLQEIMKQGIFPDRSTQLSSFNPDQIEVIDRAGGKLQASFIHYADIVTMKGVGSRIARLVSSGAYPASLATLADGLLAPFLTENVLYDADETRVRLEDARTKVEPVLKRIDRGDRIIKRGFAVSREDLVRLEAYERAIKRGDPPGITGRILLILILGVITAFMMYTLCDRHQRERILKRDLYLCVGAVLLYFLVARIFAGLPLAAEGVFISLFLPQTLFIMLISLLAGPRLALLFACVMPLAPLIAGTLDVPGFLFAILSSFSSVWLMERVQGRMDLVRSAIILALIQVVLSLPLVLAFQISVSSFPLIPVLAAVNGIISGLLVLGLLPPLEHLLKAVTVFRLVELADLNAPILKKLLATAPGTYSHSITVANLSDAACREIGANALLARVGSYYHDMGKMDQPDYFTENQVFYNKHDDIAPRLSAAVIRSHLKLGVEKARHAGLPEAVIEIIAEHHGNAVISWFYHEALKREDQVNADDFSYPGNPPHSRESAVVMLADTVEAAVRSLKKPTMSRLEKFVHELIISKFEQGQLSESELTISDLEKIKSAFVRVLAGHYHSRIEYPKAHKEAVQ